MKRVPLSKLVNFVIATIAILFLTWAIGEIRTARFKQISGSGTVTTEQVVDAVDKIYGNGIPISTSRRLGGEIPLTLDNFTDGFWYNDDHSVKTTTGFQKVKVFTFPRNHGNNNIIFAKRDKWLSEGEKSNIVHKTVICDEAFLQVVYLYEVPAY